MDKSIIGRMDRAAKVDSKKVTLFPLFPKSIKIEITSKCNYKCKYCAHSKGLRKFGDMDWKLYCKIIKEATELGVEEVGLFLLGEPFMNLNLPKFIKYAKKAGIPYIFVTTNGSLCTEKNLVKCIKAGLNSIKFSLNTPRRDYEKVHGVSAKVYDKIIQTINWLCDYKKKNKIISFNIGVSSIFNESYSDELIEVTKKLPIDTFYWLPLFNQAGHSDIKSKYIGNTGRLDNPVPAIPCNSLFSSTRVTWDGWLTACCFDHTGEFKISNINETTLSNAWVNSKLIELRKEHLNKRIENKICKKCLDLNG